MNRLLELKEDLEPVYEFTTMCEIENANQADVYIHYRSLKVKLQDRLTTRATRLLKLIKERFKSTLDIKLSKLCYFTTNAGIVEKRERIPHISEEDVLKSDEMRNKFDKEVEFFSNFSDVFNHVCPKLNLDVTSVFNSFETLLIHYA